MLYPKDVVLNYLIKSIWDYDYKDFFVPAARGEVDGAFDVFVVKFLDHNKQPMGFDTILLGYCAAEGHEAARTILARGGLEFLQSPEGYRLLRDYYARFADSERACMVWLSGFVAEMCRLDEDPTELVRTAEATGPRWILHVYRLYKKAAGMGFPLAIKYMMYMCFYEYQWELSVERRVATFEHYQRLASQYHLVPSDI